MTQLSSDEAQKIMDALLKAQADLNNLPLTIDRTPEEGEELHRLVLALGDEIDKIGNIAIVATGEELERVVNGLNIATENANGAIETLNNIRKAIKIATALIGLATAIASQQPGPILSAAKSVLNAAEFQVEI